MAEYAELMAQAAEVAETASELTLKYFRKAVLIEEKDDGSPVTAADKKAEEFIRETISRAFPDHGILGEEFGADEKSSDFLWTIDPIDGTRSFVRGIPLFGTLLGLVHRREPVLGVMVLPALGETYVAAKGEGAFCNGHRLHVSATSALEGAFVGVGDYPVFEDAGKKDYYMNLCEKAEMVRGYTDCFGHSLVIRGSIDAMVDPIVKPWDCVPIAALVREAGGDFFGFEGQMSFDNTNLSFISAAPGLKKPLLEL